MVASILLAVLLKSPTSGNTPLNGIQFWEETSIQQMNPGYHPMIRFNSWEITRFNLGTTYMFQTPQLVQQGQFHFADGQYAFNAVMANELENADIAKLLQTMDPETARTTSHEYAVSMFSFPGNYDSYSKTLTITYPVDGHPKTFELHATDEGDAARVDIVSDSERSMVGLWQAPEPNPDKLDAKTRFTEFGIDGLTQFAREADTSGGAKFSIMDLRHDRTVRIHAGEGGWRRDGSKLTVTFNGSSTVYSISREGNKLINEGKVTYVR